MKRAPRAPARTPRTVDVDRLPLVRGGDGLDIAVRVDPPIAPIMQFQHSEALIGL